MLSFRVFVALHHCRYVSPLPRDLFGQPLTRACRGLGVSPEPPRRAPDCSILFHFPNSLLSTFSRVRKTTTANGSVDFLYDLNDDEVTEVSSTGSWNRGEIHAQGR